MAQLVTRRLPNTIARFLLWGLHTNALTISDAFAYAGTGTPPPYFRPKDATATIPFGFDWADYLGTGTIASSTWSVSGPDSAMTLSTSYLRSTRQQSYVYVSGGTTGKRYTVTNRIVTSATQAVTQERSFRVHVVDQ